MSVQALYIDPRGPYPALLGAENCWDAQRDAKRYNGPHAVVVHPPCGPWGRLKFLCKHQDPSCGPRAVEQVRLGGGCLEHPEHSSLWKHCGLPKPGDPPDAWGGYTLAVRQVAWGHCCAKPTWIYVVGLPKEALLHEVRNGGEETHRVTNGSRGKTHLPRAKERDIICTPPAFAEWLVSIARRVEARKLVAA